MNANKTLGFVLTAAICAAMSVHADALPWDGARLVFGEAQRGGTFTLDAPATASEVDFIAPATLQGAELTLTPPALVRGGGALLTPLAGTDGVAVGWPAEIYTQFFAQADYQPLWTNVDLSTVVDVTGNICGQWAGQRLTPCISVAFKKLNAEGTSATVQIQSLNQGAGSWVRSFKLQLDQDGPDVKAKALWCKYAAYPEKASYYGRDWDDPDIQAKGSYAAPYSTSIVGNGADIGLTNVKPLFDVDLEGTLPSGNTVLNGRRVTFRPTQAISVSSSLTGDVQEVVFKGSMLDVREYHQDGWVMTNEEVLVARNTSITTIGFKSAIMCGNWVACDDPSLFSSYSTISGDTLTMQVQCYSDGGPGNQHTKVVFVEFRQAGSDVYMKAVAMGSKAGDYRGTNIPRNDSPVCTAGSLSNRSACNGGYGIYNVTFTYRPDTWPVTLGGAKDTLLAGARYVFDGVAVTGDPEVQKFSNNSVVVLTNGASAADLMWQDSLSVVVSTGCEMRITKDWTLHRGGDANVLIDGGTFRAKNQCYANRVTLVNGGQVAGTLMRVGAFNTTNTTTTLAGPPCFIERLNGSEQRASAAGNVPFSNWHEFRLAADLYVGGIFDVGGWEGLNWEKKGPADLHITKASGTAGSFRIREGAIVLDGDGALGKTNALELAGGEIAVGAFTNRLGALSVTADSSIRAGDGALTFSDSSASAWTPGATLSVTGEASRLASGHIRFLRENGAAGLSDGQLRAMRYNGELRVRLDGEGWLESYIPGLTVIFR